MNMVLDTKLEQVLFDEFGATYNKRRGEARFNAESDIAEVHSYLGTYFPRSWAEHTIIWKQLLQSPAVQSALRSRECIRILDVGSGTGGHLYAIIEQLRSIAKRSGIKVIAIDANELALQKQKQLHERFMFNRIDIKNIFTKFDYDADMFGQQLLHICQAEEDSFDIILSSKFLSEMGGYAVKEKKSLAGFFLNVLSVADKMLSPQGILSLVDVNIPVGNQRVAESMREEIQRALDSGMDLSVMMPSHCGLYYKKCCRSSRCYMTIPIELCHKGCADGNDITKICFRVLARSSLADQVLVENDEIPSRIKVNENGYCSLGASFRGTIDDQYISCFC